VHDRNPIATTVRQLAHDGELEIKHCPPQRSSRIKRRCRLAGDEHVEAKRRSIENQKPGGSVNEKHVRSNTFVASRSTFCRQERHGIRSWRSCSKQFIGRSFRVASSCMQPTKVLDHFPRRHPVRRSLCCLLTKPIPRRTLGGFMSDRQNTIQWWRSRTPDAAHRREGFAAPWFCQPRWDRSRPKISPGETVKTHSIDRRNRPRPEVLRKF